MADLASTLLQGSMGVASSINQKRQTDLAQARLALDTRQSNVMFGKEDGDPGIYERQMRMQEETQEAQYNKGLLMKPVGMALSFTNMVKAVPETKPLLQPVLSGIDSGELKTRADVAGRLMQMHSEGQFEATRVTIREKAAAAAQAGDEQKAAQLMALYHHTSKEGFEDFMDNMMQKPMGLRRSAAAKEGAGGGSDQGVMKAYYAPDGSIQYIPSRVQPPEGFTPYSPEYSIEVNGTTIRRGGNPNVQKRLPAGQAEQLGELDVYSKTMAEIDTIVNTGEVNPKTMTGPFEFIRKYVDKWDIAKMGDDQRQQLRAYVARLPGVMYAMRGKQLSDKEFEMAINMLPTMDMAPSAFKVQMKSFGDYMTKILNSKKGALVGAGYNAEGIGGVLDGLADDGGDELDDTGLPPPSATAAAINARGDQLADEAKARGITDPNAIEQYVMQKLQAEFGVAQ